MMTGPYSKIYGDQTEGSPGWRHGEIGQEELLEHNRTKLEQWVSQTDEARWEGDHISLCPLSLLILSLQPVLLYPLGNWKFHLKEHKSLTFS